MATLSKRNFTRGIFSPVVQARRDVEVWAAGAKRLNNVTILKHGGVRKRSGTWFVYRLPAADQDTQFLPFTYAPGQSYALLMGQATMKPIALGGMVVSAGYGITAISKANPGVVTAPFHALTTGQEVYLTGILGMTQVNGRVFTVTVLTANTFSIGVDTTAYSTFTADDGTPRGAPPAAPPTPPVVPPVTPPPVAPEVIPGGGGYYDEWWDFRSTGNPIP